MSPPESASTLKTHDTFRLTSPRSSREWISCAAGCLAGILTAYLAITDKPIEFDGGWFVFVLVALLPLIAIVPGPRLYRVVALLVLLFILFRAYTEFRRAHYLSTHFSEDTRIR